MKMEEVTQYRKVLEIEYQPEDGKMRIYHHGGEARYVTVDQVKLRPEVVAIEDITIRKQGTKIRFTEPINCNIITGRYEIAMECGVPLSEKADPRKLVEKISGDFTSEARPIWEEIKEKKDKKENQQMNYC